MNEEIYKSNEIEEQYEYEEKYNVTINCSMYIFFKGSDYVCSTAMNCPVYNQLIDEYYQCATSIC
jgi:hypothetical protein